MASHRIFSFPAVTGVVIGLLGAAFAVLAGWLVALGGTPYYVVAVSR